MMTLTEFLERNIKQPLAWYTVDDDAELGEFIPKLDIVGLPFGGLEIPPGEVALGDFLEIFIDQLTPYHLVVVDGALSFKTAVMTPTEGMIVDNVLNTDAVDKLGEVEVNGKLWVTAVALASPNLVEVALV